MMYRHNIDLSGLTSMLSVIYTHSNILIVVTVTEGVAIVSIILRWYSQSIAKRKISLDDWLLSIAMFLSIGITGASMGEMVMRKMTNDNNVLDNLSNALKVIFIQSILYFLAANLVKIAFLLKYYRLFKVIRLVRYSCYILFLITFITAAWSLFGVIFICSPTQRFWEPLVEGSCMDVQAYFRATCFIGIILNWAIWVLPIPVIGRLLLPFREKIGLFIVFGLGICVCIVSILRFVLVDNYGIRSEDASGGAYTIMWSTIEVNVALTCASLLVMKPVFVRFFPALFYERPISAREDAMHWRGAVGLVLLTDAEEEEKKKEKKKKKQEEYEMSRRDTLASCNGSSYKQISEPPKALIARAKERDRWTV